MFAITGGLAVDCVRQGHPDYIPKLIDGIADVIEDELVAWIIENGGWVRDKIDRLQINFFSVLVRLD